jgi:periplasmic protein TonB
MATAAAVAAVHALLLLLLLLPATRTMLQPPDALIMVDVPTAEPPAEAEPEPEGAEAAPAEDAVPRPVIAPEPDIVVEQPEPPVAPPAVADGQETTAGASEKPGEGTGSQGEGAGTGSGGVGSGSGGGAIARARWLSGRIDRSDYPPRANRAGQGGSVIVHFDVRADGTVHRCRVRQSSGHPDIDSTTCRLIEERFRYSPARDGRGQPVPDIAGWRQDWWLEPRR